MGETKNLKSCSSEEAKAIAFYMGLRLVKEFPNSPVQIEGDRSLIVKDYC